MCLFNSSGQIPTQGIGSPAVREVVGARSPALASGLAQQEAQIGTSSARKKVAAKTTSGTSSSTSGSSLLTGSTSGSSLLTSGFGFAKKSLLGT